MSSRLPKGLSYSSDESSGFTRRRCGTSFAFYNTDKELIRCPDTRSRLLSLAVPPAYREVWFCPDPFGHLQATGRDARGRKQYRYHEKFSAYRNQRKFDHLLDFGAALPRIRRALTRTARKAKAGDLEFVLCIVVELLDESGLRIGSETYLRENSTRGLVTLSHRNVKPAGTRNRLAHFDFVGKGGKEIRYKLAEKRLVSRIRELQDLPGQRLFRYLSPNGEYRDLTSEQANNFIAEISSQDFTAKDFRSWAGTRAATYELCRTQETDSRRAIEDAVRFAARTLGNTAAIARKSYIHPALLTKEAVEHFRSLELRNLPLRRCQSGLSKFESEMVAFLSPAEAIAV